MIHALWECGAVQNVWAGCSIKLQKSLSGQHDILQLFADLMHKLSVDDLEFFWVQCWLIWNQQNSLLHGSNLREPSRLNARARDYIEEVNATQSHLAVLKPMTTGLMNSWQAPDGLIYKLHFDGAISADMVAFGVGVMIWNDKGQVMAVLSSKGLANNIRQGGGGIGVQESFRVRN